MRIDCTHPRANHQHGTPLAYQRDDCRCDPCRDARWVTNWNYELSIFGDVMEHMQKEEAVAMWERAGQQNSIESPRYGIISIPIIHYPQGEEEGNPYERHVKEDWSVEEVLDTFKWIKSHEVFPVTMTCLAKFPA